MTREIIKKDGLGLKGINKGLGATVGRHNVKLSKYLYDILLHFDTTFFRFGI